MHRTIVLHIVLYGCETWSITLREELRVKVMENRMLRGIFGPKRDDVIGEWRKLHNEELSDLYSSPNIIRLIKLRKNEMGGKCSMYGERRGACRNLVGKTEGKRPLGRHRRRL
jgi:hypothetical protein